MKQTYLPSISSGPTLPVAPVGQPLPATEQIFLMMRLHPEQQRQNMQLDTLLTEVANAKCKDMAMQGYEGHVDPDGHGANYLARQMGYILPEWYSWDLDANNIESLGWGGDGHPAGIWQAWHDSTLGHRSHILGLNDFYKHQTRVGIGYFHAPDSRWTHYWALMTAHEVSDSLATHESAQPEIIVPPDSPITAKEALEWADFYLQMARRLL